jgi:hypothetical protein
MFVGVATVAGLCKCNLPRRISIHVVFCAVLCGCIDCVVLRCCAGA